jgi:hypothetical protein
MSVKSGVLEMTMLHDLLVARQRPEKAGFLRTRLRQRSDGQASSSLLATLMILKDSAWRAGSPRKESFPK